MAWNEPGGGNRDPWSGGGGGGRGNQGPPDLDEVIRKLRSRLEGLFGGRGGRSGGDGESSGGGGPGAKTIGVIVGLLLIGWLASGIYIVDEGTRGVVTRFGDYVSTAGPGPHWHLPYPIDEVQTVDVAQRRTISIGYEAVAPNQSRQVPSEALMLTEDENIVNVQLAVQYEVGEPAQFLYEFVNPEQTLKEVAESALREVVGKRNMDYVLTEGRAEVANETRDLVEAVMSRYRAGIEVVAVVIQDVQPPEQVQDAFLDAIMAREDRERLINQAEGYRNEVIPQAQGQAAQILQQAQAYQAEVVNRAEGDASRFTQLVAEYREAPEVTRDRLYLDTMEQVLGRSGKVLIDVESAQPLMYLPLDRMLRSGTDQGESGGSSGDMRNALSGSAGSGNQSDGGSSNSSSRLRMRETR